MDKSKALFTNRRFVKQGCKFLYALFSMHCTLFGIFWQTCCEVDGREPPEESILIIDWEVQHAPGLWVSKHIRKRIPKRSIQAQELE